MTKGELRRQARQILASVTPQAREAWSQAIAAALWSVPEIAAARTLLLFAGRPDEVETAPVAAGARARGIRLLYPRIHDLPGMMTLHEVGEPGVLRPGRHGLLEPDPALAPEVAAAAVEAVLVPGLAWDRAGGRLGRGAGYFDRLFADPAWRGFRCGLFFAGQEVPRVPTEPWDVPLEAVVTEREVWRPGGAPYG